jgi:phosphatidylglycerophosphate synthase
MLDYTLRPYKDRFLIPIARPVGLRISPTAVTLLALGTGLVAAALLLRQQYGLALVFWITSRVLDGLDGTIARAHARESDFGGYLDILGDFVVYAAIPTALVLGRPLTPAPLIALSLLLALFYVNAASWMYLSAILEKRSAGARSRNEQTTVAMPIGLVGGSETIAFYCAFILAPAHAVPLFGAMAALVGASVLQRLFWAEAHLRTG